MRLYLRLLDYLRPYLGHLAVALACMVFYGVTNFASLGLIVPLMSVLFERPAPARTSSFSVAPVQRLPHTSLPWPFRSFGERWFLHGGQLAALESTCILLLVVFFLKNLADYVQSFLMASVEQGVIHDLRGELQKRLQELSLSFYHGRRTGALVSRVTNDMEYLRAALASSISNLVKDVLTLLGALLWVFAVSWQLALLSLTLVPVAAVVLTVVGSKMGKRSWRARERVADLTAILHEYLACVRVVKAFGAEDFEWRKFERANADSSRAYVGLRRVSAAAGPFSELAIVVVALAMLWFGGRAILAGHSLAPQSFTLFVGALLTTISPTRRLTEVNAGIQQGLSAAGRIFGVLDTAPGVIDRPGVRALPPLRDRIRFEHASFAYRPGRPVLQDITFELKRGEIVALVGSSGAGKSTVMDLLARFYDPSDGRITFDGVDLRGGTVASLRAQLGIVTQETFLFHDTVRANVAYGTAGASDEAIRAAATAACAHEFISRLPLTYDTIIGERGSKLPGGERQRLAIARALLRNPLVLLLDEATSSLDAESEGAVNDALERLMHDRTVLVIAHRLSTVQRADRIVAIEHGRVAECGSHGELIRQDGVYHRLYHNQFLTRSDAHSSAAVSAVR